MISRLLSVGVVLMGLLFAGSVCLAQEEAEPDSGATAGRAALGGHLGGSQFVADADYSDGSEPRLSFVGTFRYMVTDWLRWQVSPAYTWAAYKKGTLAPLPDPNYPADTLKNEYIAQVVPVTVQLQYVFRGRTWMYHIGGGPGLYRVWVENRRKVLKDITTHDLHRGVYMGVSGELGAERFLTALPSTSIELGVTGHWIFAERDEQFPNGYNSFLGVVAAHIGVNYYYTLPGHKTMTTLPPEPGGP